MDRWLLDVPYVAASPFWWKIRVKGNLKWSDMCMVCLLFMKCSKGLSGTQFWPCNTIQVGAISGSHLLSLQERPVTLELSKGKKDLHFQTMDKYCDDLLWLESLIDGWGQTLTLITEKNHIIARITDQILITSFLQPNVALMVSCTPSNNICCALFRLTFFLDWSQDCKSWWYIRSGNTVKGIQAQQGWKEP